MRFSVGSFSSLSTPLLERVWAPPAAFSFVFDWTPPATDQGSVTLYVSANAANGNGNETGDKAYTSRSS